MNKQTKPAGNTPADQGIKAAREDDQKNTIRAKKIDAMKAEIFSNIAWDFFEIDSLELSGKRHIDTYNMTATQLRDALNMAFEAGAKYGDVK